MASSRNIFILFCVAGFSVLLAEGQTPPVNDSPTSRIIAADLNQIKGLLSMAWQECVGAGFVAEGLRADWRRQLEVCHREIGFKYLRMHGLLQDELGVYSEDAEGKPYYNWQYLDDVSDFLLSIGLKPFVEFDFIPSALASGARNLRQARPNNTVLKFPT